jgi:hypothetical protein
MPIFSLPPEPPSALSAPEQPVRARPATAVKAAALRKMPVLVEVTAFSFELLGASL